MTTSIHLNDKTLEPQPVDWEDDRSDGANDDPGAAIRFAGCSVQDEIELLGVQVS